MLLFGTQAFTLPLTSPSGSHSVHKRNMNNLKVLSMFLTCTSFKSHLSRLSNRGVFFLVFFGTQLLGNTFIPVILYAARFAHHVVVPTVLKYYPTYLLHFPICITC